MAIIRLSELLKIGVRYFELDSVNTVFFNDGTRMYSRYSEGNNGEGSSWDDLEFVCLRGDDVFDVLDDVHHTLPTAERVALGTIPSDRKRRSWRQIERK